MRPEFIPFPKMARISREMVITEKLDGTNAQVVITPEGEVFAASRTRYITPTDDNYGFARWVEENKEQLLTLGPGNHFGEWWGAGIQRRYGLTEKRFSLFNVERWDAPGMPRPACCGLVPVLYRGPFSTVQVDFILDGLARNGSAAAPGFMDPEGIIIFHTASRTKFKKTIKDDDKAKSA